MINFSVTSVDDDVEGFEDYGTLNIFDDFEESDDENGENNNKFDMED